MISKKAVYLVLLLGACTSASNPNDGTELSRTKSPDGLVEAILYRHEGGGATVGFSYSIYLARTGMFPNEYSEVFLATHPEDLTITWRENKFLKIGFTHAEIYSFTNFWYSNRLGHHDYFVELRLIVPDTIYAIKQLYQF